MATKTKSKTATKKPAAHKAVKVAASHKSATKAKVEKKAKVVSHAKTAPVHHAAPAKKTHAHPAPAAKTEKPALAPQRQVESVSLIDEKKTREAVDGEVKKKSTVLPPISRIRESLKTPPKPEPPPVKIESV